MFGFINIGKRAEEVVKKLLSDAVREADDSITKVISLKTEIRQLKDEKQELTFKKELEERELSHLLKMRDEKSDIEFKKKEVELEKSFQKREMELQKIYFDKVMHEVKEAQTNMQTIYGEILQRLPNVNMEIKEKRR